MEEWRLQQKKKLIFNYNEKEKMELRFKGYLFDDEGQKKQENPHL